MGNSVKLVFFDIGGVVVQADLERYTMVGVGLFASVPENLRREVVSRVPALERGKMDSATFWKEVGESLWRRGEGRPAPPDQCRHLWRDLMLATARLDPATVELCGLLKAQGLRIGALSNTIEDHIPVLTEMGVYAMFDPCVLSCRQGHRKPEREIYRRAAEMAGLKPKQCLLVDDVPDNVEGARRAGMQGVLFTTAEEALRELVRLRVVG